MRLCRGWFAGTKMAMYLLCWVGLQLVVLVPLVPLQSCQLIYPSPPTFSTKSDPREPMVGATPALTSHPLGHPSPRQSLLMRRDVVMSVPQSVLLCSRNHLA